MVKNVLGARFTGLTLEGLQQVAPVLISLAKLLPERQGIGLCREGVSEQPDPAWASYHQACVAEKIDGTGASSEGPMRPSKRRDQADSVCSALGGTIPP